MDEDDDLRKEKWSKNRNTDFWNKTLTNPHFWREFMRNRLLRQNNEENEGWLSYIIKDGMVKYCVAYKKTGSQVVYFDSYGNHIRKWFKYSIQLWLLSKIQYCQLWILIFLFLRSIKHVYLLICSFLIIHLSLALT